MVVAAWQVLLELAPWLLLGAVVSGAVHALLPQGFVHRQLNGRWGVLKATALGVPMPLCSCGVIPATLGLKKDGASDGAAIAFLVSTPQTGVDSILVSASFLGLPFALFKVFAATSTGLVAGALVDATGGAQGTAPLTREETHDDRSAWARGLAHADDVIGSIWGWLAFGVLASAALTTWIPLGALSGTVLGSGPLASLAVLLIAIPLYVCATASVPIAAGLLHAGLPPSAALVFLLAGPASNVATIGAVYKAFGGRVLATYLGTVAIGSYALGLLFDAVLPTDLGSLAAHHHDSPTAALAAIVLLLLMARYAARDLEAWMRPPMQAVTLSIPVAGMTCNKCAGRVETAARGIAGVTAAEVRLTEGLLVVDGVVDRAALCDAVRKAGYQPTG